MYIGDKLGQNIAAMQEGNVDSRGILECQAERLADAISRLTILTFNLEDHAARLFGGACAKQSDACGIAPIPAPDGAVSRMDELLNNLHEQIFRIEGAVASNCRLA